MNFKEKILDYAKENNGIITTRECREQDIPTIYLSRLVEEGSLNRINRGVYLSEDGVYDEYYILQQRYRQIVYSYETALFLHGLIDLIPKKIIVTVPYSYKINKAPGNLTVRYVKEDIALLGAEELRTNIGNKVIAYDLERTIVDIINNPDFVDRETYTTSIRNYMEFKNKDISKLFNYALKMDLVDKVRNVIEVLQNEYLII